MVVCGFRWLGGFMWLSGFMWRKVDKSGDFMWLSGFMWFNKWFYVAKWRN